MIFMIAFWVCFLIGLILVLANKKIKDYRLENIASFFLFMQFIFIIIAISTNDPIFEAIGMPKGYEWIAGLVMSGFTLWLFYLNPLKNRVVEVEKDTSSIKTSVSHIQGDVSWIKDNCKVSFKQ